MIRLVAIGFLLTYLISFTEFREALRLPLLVQHYTEHKSKVDELTFWEFLVMHYETDVAHDDTDMKLPFKDCNHSFGSPTFVLLVQKMILSEGWGKTAHVYPSFYLLHEPKLLEGDIFQPPKL